MARLDEIFRVKRSGLFRNRRQIEDYRKRVKAAYCLLTGLLSAQELARAFGTSESLIYYWCDSVLNDYTPESEALRRIARVRRGREFLSDDD